MQDQGDHKKELRFYSKSNGAFLRRAPTSTNSGYYRFVVATILKRSRVAVERLDMRQLTRAG